MKLRPMDKDFNLPLIGKVRIVNFPRTMTILALGFMFGNLLFVPMIAWLGKYIPDAYQSSVSDITGLFKDGMLMILGCYFRDQMHRVKETIENERL